ncbi:MAG: flagellar motor switch protein FliY, partial [Epsilonproteobacteria bacterium]|nr:flagellar motor switch protein FliY [Campylobacterota bacterium]
MNNFLNLLTAETVSVIEGLTGHAPELSLAGDSNIDASLMIEQPLALATLKCEKGSLALAMEVSLATALGDMMLGGEGEEQASMGEDELDAAKEIISNIFGAISTALSAQQDLPNLSFEVEEIEFLEEGSNFENFIKLYTIQTKIASTNAGLYLAGSQSFIDALSTIEMTDAEDESDEHREPQLSPEELKNMELLLDVPLPVRVRIGTKTVLLKDVLNMDIGSVVE